MLANIYVDKNTCQIVGILIGIGVAGFLSIPMDKMLELGRKRDVCLSGHPALAAQNAEQRRQEQMRRDREYNDCFARENHFLGNAAGCRR